MLFKSMGVALATRAAGSSDDMKPITLRLTENEVQLYDVVAKTMGLNRQDFLSHLIRSNFKNSFQEFLLGYTESNPSVSLQELMYSHTDSDELKGRIWTLLKSISQELQVQDEEDIHKHIEEVDSRFYEYAEPRKGIFPDLSKKVTPVVDSEGFTDA